MPFSTHWGWLGLLGLGLAVALSGDTPIPDRWALVRTLHPDVQARFLDLLRRIEATGWTVVLTSGKRPGISDYHGFGLALDLNVHRGNVWLRKADTKTAWEASGVPAIIRALGFRWGGDFVSPYVYNGKTYPGYDPVHADLGRTYNIATLRTRAAKLYGAALVPVDFDARRVSLAA